MMPGSNGGQQDRWPILSDLISGDLFWKFSRHQDLRPGEQRAGSLREPRNPRLPRLRPFPGPHPQHPVPAAWKEFLDQPAVLLAFGSGSYESGRLSIGILVALDPVCGSGWSFPTGPAGLSP